MRYSDEEIMRRLRLGEDSAWEFKRVEFSGDRPTSPVHASASAQTPAVASPLSRDDWANEVAAFANANGGVLLCGVSDDGDVLGMSRQQIVRLDALLVEVCTDSIEPPVRIRTEHRELAGGKPVLLVEVPQGDSLHEGPGGAYIRVGASKRKMKEDERMRLAQRRGQARFRWFDEQPVPGTGFRTLEEELWKPLLSAEGAADPESALTKLALLAADDAGVTRATVAGILFCTRNPERWLRNASITATRYRGGDRASGQVDSQDITGPLSRQIADAVAFAVRNMQVAARKVPARVEMPQYSDRALFEAVVNAVAHRDYSMRSSRIRLSMFRDRLEIQSPGSLPNNLTVESMATRQATRNEILTSVLGRMPVEGVRGSEERQYFMERRGDGVPIIQRETRELCGKPAAYRLIDNSELCLTIPAAKLEPSPAVATVTLHCAGRPLSGVELLILFPNKTWKQAATDQDGEAAVDLYTTHLPMTVFAAAPGVAAHVERDWAPEQRALGIEMHELPGGGSCLFPEATGYIPGLTGRLNPIRDTHDRTYLYASNIAISEGRQQPVHFVLGETLRLTDADGREALVRIVDIVGRSALVEYRPYVKGERAGST